MTNPSHIKTNLLISSIICIAIGSTLIMYDETAAGSYVGAPIALAGILFFIAGMSMRPKEKSWSNEEISQWKPAEEVLADAGRVMYRIDTTLDDPKITTILCGSCTQITEISGIKPAQFVCPICKSMLWEEEE